MSRDGSNCCSSVPQSYNRLRKEGIHNLQYAQESLKVVFSRRHFCISDNSLQEPPIEVLVDQQGFAAIKRDFEVHVPVAPPTTGGVPAVLWDRDLLFQRQNCWSRCWETYEPPNKWRPSYLLHQGLLSDYDWRLARDNRNWCIDLQNLHCAHYWWVAGFIRVNAKSRQNSSRADLPITKS